MNILIVDNKSYNQSRLNARLTKINEYQLTHLDIDIAPKPKDALQKVKEITYDFIFLDLKLSDDELQPYEEPEFDGIQLCADIRSTSQSSIIVLYSADIIQNSEKDFQYYANCVEAKPDFILSKTELYNMTVHQLYEFMKINKKNKEGLLLKERPLYYDDSIKTKALIESLGSTTITDIINKLVPKMIDDRLEVIESGYSGASVFIVNSSSDEKKQFNIQNVIKISKYRSNLETELKSAPTPGSYLHSFAVTPTSIEPMKINDYFCIKIPKVRNAKLLSDILLEKQTKLMKDTFSLVIKTLILGPISEAFSWDYSLGIVSDNYILSYQSGYEILNSLKLIKDSTKLLSKKYISHTKYIEKFILQYYENAYKFTNSLHQLAYLHGDIHCKNIFYIQNQNPIIIDFGRSNIYPRLFDAAALQVDLLVSNLDSLYGKSNNLSNIERWTEISSNLYPLTTKIVLNSTNPVITLTQMLGKQLLEDVNNLSRTEYAEVLVFQLLRYLRFPTVSFVKKIFIVEYLYSLIKKYLIRR